MTLKDKNKLEKKIKEELLSLEKNILDLEKFCEPIAPECALGDLTRFELIHEQEVSTKALEQALIRKTKLIYALCKIEDKNFGLCIECDEEIGLQRLLLLPESTHCISCLSL